MSGPLDWITAGGTVAAAVAGAVAALAAWRAAEASKSIAQEARHAQLEDEAQQISHGAALTLLEGLADLRDALPKLHRPTPGRPRFMGEGPDAEEQGWQQADQVRQDFNRMVEIYEPLLVDERVRDRVRSLRDLVHHYVVYQPELTTSGQVLRGQADCRAYADCVRSSLVALIGRREPPNAVAPPHIGRDDTSSWEAAPWPPVSPP